MSRPFEPLTSGSDKRGIERGYQTICAGIGVIRDRRNFASLGAVKPSHIVLVVACARRFIIEFDHTGGDENETVSDSTNVARRIKGSVTPSSRQLWFQKNELGAMDTAQEIASRFHNTKLA